jgi:hypothetical protein
MCGRRAGFAFAALALVLAATPASAADISAGTMAAVSDLLSSVAPDRPPPGANPDIWRKAIEALKKEGLAGAARPAQPGDSRLLQSYGNALLLGPRAGEFRDQVGAVHDAVLSGDEGATAGAIGELYRSLGRPVPKDDALAKLVEAARRVGGTAPSETINHVIERPGYRIDIVDAPAARKTAVEVVIDDGPDGKPARVLFDGTTRTAAKPGGEGLERRTDAAPACAMDERAATALREKLNGEWHGPNGTTTISGSGGKIILVETNRSGRPLRYEGTYRLGRIDARHAIRHADDMDQALPADIRAQLAGMGLHFTLRLETCRDGQRLEGRWGSQHVTYNMFRQVERVHDPYDKPFVISRAGSAPDYQIVRLDVSYAAWEAAQAQLRARHSLAADDLKRAEERLRQENAAYNQRSTETNAALRAFAKAEQAREAAERAIVDYVPADAAKNDAYRALERRRVPLARRIDNLYDGIIAAADAGRPAAPAAFDNYDRMRAELDGIDRELARLDQALGFDDERQRLRKAATEAFVAMVRAEITLHGAAAVQDLARARENEADVAYFEAQQKLSAAEQELARFTSGAVRISGVTAEDGAILKYETVYWDPREVLAFLDREIPELERVLKRAAAARREARADFLDRQANASQLQNELADAIMTSAWAQAGVETAFNLYDVVEKTLEAGPIGAIGEGGKKLVEAVILGPPGFYEPAMAPELLTGDGGPFADIRKDVEVALKYSAKRGFKTGITGQGASLLVKKYIETRSTQTYMRLIDQAVQGSMETGYRIAGPSQAMKAVEAFEAMERARENFRKALKDGAFPRYADIAGKSLKETLKNAAKDPRTRKLGVAIAKDIAKGELKEQVGEWIEGSAMRAYIAAEAEARLATQIFLAAGSVYWEARDPYEARVAERREILRQYDPRNHMQIRRNERFPDGASILIVLRDGEGRPLSATNHAMTVTLGGRPPKETARDEFFFIFDAADLEHDGKGGVVLDISVER